MKNDGYIVFEAIGLFVPLILLMASILSLVNIVTLQTRIHYAMTQAANTLSMYCYVLDVAGLSDKIMSIDEGGEQVRAEIDSIKENVAGVLEGITSIQHDNVPAPGALPSHKPLSYEESIADRPAGVMDSMIDFALSESFEVLLEKLVRPIIGRYLANGIQTGDEYLQSVNVINGLKGLSFHDFDLLSLHNASSRGSTLLNMGGEVRLVVHYEVEYMFGVIPLPFRPSMRIAQTVVTKAWLGGAGSRYGG